MSTALTGSRRFLSSKKPATRPIYIQNVQLPQDPYSSGSKGIIQPILLQACQIMAPGQSTNQPPGNMVPASKGQSQHSPKSGKRNCDRPTRPNQPGTSIGGRRDSISNAPSSIHETRIKCG
ncbi:hypothetical protein Nepgr_009331 [Nepenthes gracilis]|uniref:Uncharacterized protein n=1 Tax=Nepenthes gracilis TaxID=150966 RepID=A0AAD3SB46_NEPGR|nr:hypothetical protein Nepgr_009331 [Nepenthes gracilis]